MGIELKLQQRMLETLSEHTGKPIERFKSQAYLWRDLKVGGDDIVEILESLVDEFNLDLENFRYWENFPTEGELGSLIYYLKSLFDKQRKVDDLTVERLLAVLTQSLPESSKSA